MAAAMIGVTGSRERAAVAVIALSRMASAESKGLLAGLTFALLLVALLSVILILLSAYLPIEHVTIVYLIPVIVAALRWGTIPALFAGILGMGAPAFFFYAPIYDFRVSRPAQIVDIVMFVTVAVITGRTAIAVRRAKMRAQAESLRDALIGSVSHELRTPLAGIIGTISVLAHSPKIAADETLSVLVDGVRREAERLNGDIQNLLDATRISNDGIRPHWEWVDPEDIVNGALARTRPYLGDRPVTISVADDLPLVYADASLIESVLSQLIENAAKYSPVNRPVTISALHDGERILIKVADEGDGIPYGDTNRIFERFYRDPRHVGSVPGSGLGLWIARALVEACGGRIEAFSLGPNQGTTLQIELPLKVQPASDEEADE